MSATLSAADAKALVDELREGLGDALVECEAPAPRRVFFKVARDDLLDAVRFMVDRWGLTHISTISGRDVGDRFEVLYHFFARGCVVTLRVDVEKGNPSVPTITDLIPGATFYEREVNDLLGVFPEGHPNPERLVLPDDWPEGVHPLRKDWTPEGGGDEGGKKS